MSQLILGVVGTSKKKNEKRVPLHPEHLARLPESVRQQLVFEEGYGTPFDWSDADLVTQCGGIATRHEILADIGSAIIAKPMQADLQELRKGGILWGYPHCTQQSDITQIAIDRKLTLVAFEDMFVWGPEGEIGRHTFYKNNELAGYCAVLDALRLRGIDGHYGNQRKTIIFGFGAVSRGAIYALKAHGFRDITICIQRPDHEVREEVLDCHYARLCRGDDEAGPMIVVEHDGSERPLSELISESELIINGTFQDAMHPLMFITNEEPSCLKPGTLIIDVSCDEGMGFSFARPTTFDDPMFKVDGADYYGVDHTPSYLWESATRSISAALLVYIPAFVAGRQSWQGNETIRQAINIDEGVIKKPEILSFQDREPNYPHAALS
jgi:alanine dehydrogenase